MLVGEDIFKDTNDEFSSGGASPSRISDMPSERTPMIEKVFEEVLGRKPSSRELAYYKYGVMKEDDIRKKLLKSDEHVKLVENSKKLPDVQDELKSVRIAERKLSQKIEDTRDEIVELKKLLEHKDVVIGDLRQKVDNPYDIPSDVQKYEEGFEVYTQAQRVEPVIPHKRSLKQTLIEIIDVLFK